MKKKKKILIEDDDRFVIYQIYTSFDLLNYTKKFEPLQVCSPMHGTNITNKNSYIDNENKVDVDYGYDYLREDKDKHLTDEKLIEKHGTKYYEFDILDNKKIQNIYGVETNSKEYTVVQEPPKKKETINSFISSLDELVENSIDTKVDNINSNETITQEVKDDIDLLNDELEFKINIDEELNENINDNLTFKETTFLDKELENIDTNINFDSLPNMKAPTIHFDEDIKISEKEKNDDLNSNSTDNNPVEKEEVINKYLNYYVPFETLFKKSCKVEEETPIWLEEKKEIINKTLKDFEIDGEVIAYTKGPTFTQYEIYLSPGVNVKKVNQIYDNLQMNLQAKSIRLQLPIPGKPTIGVEVPNPKAEMVPFGDTLSNEFINDGKPLNVAMGKKIDGSILYQDITDMPHALIAGATQSGKSVSINTILMSLIIKNSPDVVRLILVDPKKVEFSFYEGIPHLCTPVITDVNEAASALKWACEEMDRRYDLFQRNRCRKITQYNELVKTNPSLNKMPYIVVVVDEFNDLVMQCGDDVNDYIIRLAQKARACGMHIILATQKPTVDVVNGTIKSNIPCRFAFRVSSRNDSMVILDEIGAENLLGRGDMLFKNGGNSERAQGSYVDDDEIIKCCDYIVNNYGTDYLFSHADLKKQMLSGNIRQKEESQETPEMLYEIACYCMETNKCSSNEIMKQFNFGFNRSTMIANTLAEKGIVSKPNGTRPREILVHSYEEIKKLLGIEE